MTLFKFNRISGGRGPAGRRTPFTTARRLLRATTFKSAETQVHAMPKSKPKLPGSTVTAPLKFEESEGFWASVEERTGPLKQKRRKRLRYIINSYFARAQFEANATDLALADKRLADIRKTATAFWKALTATRAATGQAKLTFTLSMYWTASLGKACGSPSFWDRPSFQTAKS